MKRLLLLLAFTAAMAFGQTRAVVLTWTASTSTGITGYNVSRGTSTTGPFTLLTASPVTVATYTDSTAAIGSTYTYQVVTVAPACTATTPVGTSCGSSQPASATTNVPPYPATVSTVTLTVP